MLLVRQILEDESERFSILLEACPWRAVGDIRDAGAVLKRHFAQGLCDSSAPAWAGEWL